MAYRDQLNVLRRLLEDERFGNVESGSAFAGIDPVAMDEMAGGGAPAYELPPDFSNVRGGASTMPRNVLAAMRQDQPEPEALPAVMPRTTVEDPRRWQSAPGSDLPMNSFRIESGPNAGQTRSLNFADINPAWGKGEDLQPDYSQPIEIAGVGKGYYEKGGTGNAIINGKRVALGVDRDATYRRQKQAQDLAKGEADIAHQREQTAALQAQRTTREDPTTQAALEKRFGKAEKGYQWTAEGRQVPMPGGEVESQKIDAVAGAQDTIGKIDALLAHPGLSDAVGLKGWGGLSMALGKPAVAGTDAADFVARLDEIKGGAFLQAFESLKGGGQITEVEGKKATDAITRMRTAQSEKEFRQAANEFRGVVERGMQRAQARGGQAPKSAGGNLLQEARAAIAKGAPREAVLARLRERGVDPTGL